MGGKIHFQWVGTWVCKLSKQVLGAGMLEHYPGLGVGVDNWACWACKEVQIVFLAYAWYTILISLVF